MGGALWKQNSTPQKGSALKLYLAQRNRAPKSIKSIPCPPVNNSARSLPLPWRGHGEAGMQLVIWGEALYVTGVAGVKNKEGKPSMLMFPMHGFLSTPGLSFEKDWQ